MGVSVHHGSLSPGKRIKPPTVKGTPGLREVWARPHTSAYRMTLGWPSFTRIVPASPCRPEQRRALNREQRGGGKSLPRFLSKTRDVNSSSNIQCPCNVYILHKPLPPPESRVQINKRGTQNLRPRPLKGFLPTTKSNKPSGIITKPYRLIPFSSHSFPPQKQFFTYK